MSEIRSFLWKFGRVVALVLWRITSTGIYSTKRIGRVIMEYMQKDRVKVNIQMLAAFPKLYIYWWIQYNGGMPLP